MCYGAAPTMRALDLGADRPLTGLQRRGVGGGGDENKLKRSNPSCLPVEPPLPLGEVGLMVRPERDGDWGH